MKSYLFLLLLFFFSFSALLNANAIPAFYSASHGFRFIEGVVVDANTNEPLSGVSVQLKNETVGTTTDNNGHFRLNVSENAILVFSILGYEQQEVSVGGKSSLNISLVKSNAIQLENVVVMGYRTMSREQLTGSVSQLSGTDLVDKSVTSSNPIELLQGKSAGTFISNSSGQPGSVPDIQIRGTGSITAGTSPLYVIDGVIAGDGSNDALAAISPNDIESISILKDATATALYGSRASNGVVVINTKSGSIGQTKLDLRASGGTTHPIKGNLRMMNSQEAYDFHQEMGDPTLTQSVLDHNTDWPDLLLRNGTVQTYGASISGGDKKTRFYTSFDYYKELGTLLQTNFDRLSGRVNLITNVTKRFQVSARVAGNFQRNRNIADGNHYNVLNYAYRMMPWDFPYNDDGSVRSGLEQDWYTRDHENPLYEMQWNFNRGKASYFSGNLQLKYDFTDWLDFTTTNQFTLGNSNGKIYYDEQSQRGGSNGGEIHDSRSENSNVLTSNIFHFHKAMLGGSMSALAGYEYQRNLYNDMGSVGIGVPSGMYVLDASAQALSTSGTANEYEFVSQLAEANYSYKNLYNIVGSIRRDGSSRFGAAHKYGTFYSGGVSWNIINEAFMSNLRSSLNQLKLRLSYGTIGNADISNYESYGLYSYANEYSGITASTPLQPENADLTWEVAHSLDLGIDISIMKRIDLSIDLYQKTNKNLLQSVVLPGTSGYDTRALNIGTVRNQGLEFSITSRNIDNASFKWTTDLNMSFNKNKVLSLFNDESINRDDIHQIIMVGRSINTFYLRKWAGVNPDDGSPSWEIGNDGAKQQTGNYNDAQLQIVGVADPNFFGGLTNTFQYRGFILSVFFNFIDGNKIYNGSREDSDADGAYPTLNQRVLSKGESRWENPGDEATEPKPIFGGNNNSQKPSTRYLEDGSFLRLKNVRLSYELPDVILNRISVHSLQIYVSGDNLMTLTNYTGRDPEAPIGEGVLVQKYPLSTRIVFGVNVGL